tara:strand:- start:314 stop:778 length:465 start_codon:yes stop_codon:yes gene_type:complete
VIRLFNIKQISALNKKILKESMKKILGLLLGFSLLTGCVESLALLGPSTTAATGGNIAQSAFSTAVNYGVKKQTGKSPMEHALAYADEINPEEKKEPCLSFAEQTNSEICAIVKKQLELTKSKILMSSKEKSIKDLTSSLKSNINKKSKLKYLD